LREEAREYWEGAGKRLLENICGGKAFLRRPKEGGTMLPRKDGVDQENKQEVMWGE